MGLGGVRIRRARWDGPGWGSVFGWGWARVGLGIKRSPQRRVVRMKQTQQPRMVRLLLVGGLAVCEVMSGGGEGRGVTAFGIERHCLVTTLLSTCSIPCSLQYKHASTR